MTGIAFFIFLLFKGNPIMIWIGVTFTVWFDWLAQVRRTLDSIRCVSRLNPDDCEVHTLVWHPSKHIE
jgi:hypothetical protein